MTVRPASQANTPAAGRLATVLQQLARIVVGKDEPLKLALACMLARGHLLIEDIPGVGKSTLAQALAATLGLKYSRIQFTSDLLPADVLGVSIFDERTQSFRFHAGPIFSSVVLADEINRAPPKTQSALLEAMEERQVSQDGQTRKLPDPFFVIATQNPVEQIGAYPLPESQLDRFLMAIELGYPDPAAERDLFDQRRSPRQDRRHAARRRRGDAGRLAARSRGNPRCPGAARLRAGAARRVAWSIRWPRRQWRRRIRGAPRIEPARRPHAARRRARMGDDRRPADGAAGGCAGGVSGGRRPSPGRRHPRRGGTGPGARAHVFRCRRSRARCFAR